MGTRTVNLNFRHNIPATKSKSEKMYDTEYDT